jgi:lysophospholipase L1-like esterase
MKKLLLIPLLILSFFAGAQVTPQWRAVTGGLLVNYPGKTPVESDTVYFNSHGSSGSYFSILTRTSVKTSTYTATANQLVPTDATSSSFPVLLPAAPTNGTLLCVEQIAGTGITSILTQGSDTFAKSGGVTTLSLSGVNEAYLFTYTSGIWTVLSHHLPITTLDARYAPISVAGSVTSFSKTDNFGIISSVTNPTTTPNHAVGVDTTAIGTIARINGTIPTSVTNHFEPLLGIAGNSAPFTRKISAVGSSLTAGVTNGGVTTVAQTYLYQTGQQSGYSTLNYGVGGRAMQSITTGDNSFTTNIGGIPPPNNTSDILLLETMVNDVVHTGYTSSAYQTALTTYVNQAITNGWTAAQIILYNPSRYSTTIFGQSDTTRHTSYTAAMQSVATSLGTKYLDTWNQFKHAQDTHPAGTYLYSDSLHMTPAGQSFAAGLLTTFINTTYGSPVNYSTLQSAVLGQAIINGDANITGTLYAGNKVRLPYYAPGGGGYAGLTNLSTHAQIGVYPNGGLYSNQFVGIGTDNPLVPVHIVGTGLNSRIYIWDTTTPGSGSGGGLQFLLSQFPTAQSQREMFITAGSLGGTASTQYTAGSIEGVSNGLWSTSSLPFVWSIQATSAGSATRSERVRVGDHFVVQPAAGIANAGVAYFTADAQSGYDLSSVALLPVTLGGTGAATLSGLVKGNGTSPFTAAVAGTDYQAPLTFDSTPTSSSTNPVTSGGLFTKFSNYNTAVQDATIYKQNLLIGSNVIYFGDSITQHGNASQIGNQDGWGFTTWFNIYTGGKLYNPTGGDLGIAGQTTTQMIARLGAALAYKPALVTFMAGTNDITAAATAVQIETNISIIVTAFNGINAKVVISTILPRYGASALTTGQEIIRQAVNAYILTLASSSVIVVNSESAMSNSAYYVDGLHPNSQGASVLGGLYATAISPYLPTTNWAQSFGQDGILSANYALTGTTGTVTGATGTAPTGYTLYAAGAGGATVVGSQGTAGGLNQSIITLSGTYTGTSSYIQLSQTINPTTLTTNQLAESVFDFSTSSLTNVAGIGVDVVYYDAGSTFLGDAYSYYPNDGLALNLANGRYQIRGQAFATPAGTSFIQVNAKIALVTPATSLPVSGVVTIYASALHQVQSVSNQTQVANNFLAAPNGSSGVADFRSLVSADIPTLNQSTTGNAATATKLATARTINGVSFDGTGNILVNTTNSLTATNATLTFSSAFNGSAASTVGINLANANSWSGTQTLPSFILGSNTTNIYQPFGAAPIGNNTAAQYLFGGATTTAFRTGFYGSTNSSLATGVSYAAVIDGAAPMTTFTSGTHAYIGTHVFKATPITNAGATVTNSFTGYFEAGTGATNNYSVIMAGAEQKLGSASGGITYAVPATVTSYTQTDPAAAPTANGQVKSYTTAGIGSWATPALTNVANTWTATQTLGSGFTLNFTNSGFTNTLQSNTLGNNQNTYLPSNGGILGVARSVVSVISGTTVVTPTLLASDDYNYQASTASLSNILLPPLCAVGARIYITGTLAGTGGWKVSQNAGDKVYYLTTSTTAGTGGFITNGTSAFTSLMLVCIVANTGSGGTYVIQSCTGTPSLN